MGDFRPVNTDMVEQMGGRIESRKEIMEEAHEGHEEYHSEIVPVREGPRSWFYEGRYFNDRNALMNWRPSERTLMGLIVMVVGLAIVLVLVFWLVGKYLLG